MTTTICTVRRKTMTLRRAHFNLATRLFSAGLVLVVAIVWGRMAASTRLTTGTEGHTIIPEVDSAERCGGFVATFET